MSSSPKKQQATKQERSLYNISQDKMAEVRNIRDNVQDQYLDRVKKDNSQALRNRVNADAMQLMKFNPSESPFDAAKRLSSGNNIRHQNLNDADFKALAELNTNKTNAVRTGKNMQTMATAGLTNLANLKQNEMQRQMARDSMIDSARTNAYVLPLAALQSSAMSETGLFAKDTPGTTTSTQITPSNLQNSNGVFKALTGG